MTLDARAAGAKGLPFDGLFGVFGEYGSLSILTPHARAGGRVFMQDLLSDEAVDVTGHVGLSDGKIRLPGSLIRQVSALSAHPGDTSDPGVVVFAAG